MGSEVCPYCNAPETRESDRDYPHWRQFDCGSLLIDAEEGGIDQSQKCCVRQRDMMVAAAKDDFGNAVVALTEKVARIAALEGEVERLRESLEWIAKPLTYLEKLRADRGSEYVMDWPYAIKLANTAGFLSEIASKALSTKEPPCQT